MCKNFLSLDTSLEIGFFIHRNSNLTTLKTIIPPVYHMKTEEIGDHKALHIFITTTVGSIYFLLAANNEIIAVKAGSETPIGELTEDDVYTNVICPDTNGSRFRYVQIVRNKPGDFRIKVVFTETLYVADVLFISTPIDTVSYTIGS